jgi:hypothetical protein
MLEWGLGFLEGLANFASDPLGTVAGWTFDKVTAGIYEWLARGLALLIEWVWEVLDAGTTPRLTEDWFANELAGRVGALALAVTIAMMLASAIQAALAGRPGQVGDATKEAARAIVASAFTITVVDVMVGVVDEAAAGVWQIGRDDLVAMIERTVAVATAGGPLATTFVGPLCLLFGFLGLLGLTVSMLMRSALIYLVAALAPLVWSSSVLPLMRDSSRRLVHLLVALIVSKLAIVISLVVAVQLAANPGGDPDTTGVDLDAAAAVGTLVTGFACFLVAAISPMVLYRLMPTVEGAVASAGVVGGWGRAAMSVGQAALMTKGLGAAAAATRAVAGQQGVTGHTGGQAVTGLAAATSAGAGSSPTSSSRPRAPGGGSQPSTGDGGASADSNLPPLPGPGSPPSTPKAAPWVPPGAPAADTPLASSDASATSTSAQEQSASTAGGDLPPLPRPRPPAQPWVPPGTPATEGHRTASEPDGDRRSRRQ